MEPPKPGAYIRGVDSIVLAAKDGIVAAVFTIGDLSAVMILSGKQFYTYSDLDSVLFSKGESVKAGMCIGVSRRRRVDFTVTNKNDRYFWPDQYLDCRTEFKKSK
jgi:hypothetical protein